MINATSPESAEVLSAVLDRRRPSRVPYASNYWQWFEHQRRMGLPQELAGCDSQLEFIRHLGLDVFSRNVYCDQQRVWFGGLCDAVWQNVEFEETVTDAGDDRVYHLTYRTRKGTLTERLRYVGEQSTLVQEKFLIDDPESQSAAFEELILDRRWRFLPDRYDSIAEKVGPGGIVLAGEVFSPLKLLHLSMNPIETCYFLADSPDLAEDLLAVHERAMLDLLNQIVSHPVRGVVSMDNLDTTFHTPRLVERCSARFYERASRMCHEHGSTFFIHACGKQRDNLALIGGLGVDGLEGVAFPSLGDVELDEAMRLSGDRLIITGGVSAMEFERLHSREEVFSYTRDLFRRMAPYAHRFVFSASCTTPYSAPLQTLNYFRDAWKEFGAL